MSIGVFICGCAGTRFNEDEQAFLKEANPWGLILFARNVESSDQLNSLTSEFRAITGRDDAPILIDQEGGRVQRMLPPNWRKYPPASRFGALFTRDPVGALTAARLVTRLLAEELFDVGITVDCLPVLDVPQPGSHSVIGDRAYAEQARDVAILARAAVGGLMDGGVLPVVKHIPGHGRATADSHHELPTVNSPLEALRDIDFMPFAALADLPMAMTAHVVYSAIDPEMPATLSAAVIEQVIRRDIGFDGLIMTDDLSMKALSGSTGDKVARAQSAGCDMMLHCNGDMAEMQEVAAAAGSLTGQALSRAEVALACARAPKGFDGDAALEALHRFDIESV